MICLKKTLAAGLAVAAFAGTLSGFAAPARADRDHESDRGGSREREWRDHDHRREEWRGRRYDSRYYYGNRIYVSPPVVYGPPPPPSGLNLLFNIR
jgi:Ni/Co efflux regulator RcnB